MLSVMRFSWGPDLVNIFCSIVSRASTIAFWRIMRLFRTSSRVLWCSEMEFRVLMAFIRPSSFDRRLVRIWDFLDSLVDMNEERVVNEDFHELVIDSSSRGGFGEGLICCDGIEFIFNWVKMRIDLGMFMLWMEL